MPAFICSGLASVAIKVRRQMCYGIFFRHIVLRALPAVELLLGVSPCTTGEPHPRMSDTMPTVHTPDAATAPPRVPRLPHTKHHRPRDVPNLLYTLMIHYAVLGAHESRTSSTHCTLRR
ncbi:hypothetical protein Hypma_013308 [Hypsizygus marmoreus]|uniref:Uncharacterized protein n=1 Tax=Hypsizygus marmoreus TaxID=39966 RepID=A0A369JEH8_HYPMA|nr:hypothetical protein Hypma_013308 [Hypsizygus marmoreus]